MGIKSFTNGKSDSLFQSKRAGNHDLISFACPPELTMIGSAKSMIDFKSFFLSFHKPIFLCKIGRTHNWKFPIFKKKLFFFPIEPTIWKRFDAQCTSNQIFDCQLQIPLNLLWLGVYLVQIPILLWLGMADCEIGFDTQFW